MAPDQIKKIIEAALMAVDKPLTIAHLHALFANEEEPVDRSLVKDALAQLQGDYEDRGVSIVEVASGYRVQICLLYTSPSPRDQRGYRMPSSA